MAVPGEDIFDMEGWLGRANGLAGRRLLRYRYALFPEKYGKNVFCEHLVISRFVGLSVGVFGVAIRYKNLPYDPLLDMAT
jgi:hypothetical protein